MVQRAYQAYLQIVLGGKSGTAFGGQYALSSTTVTLYRRLGIALAVVGIEPDSELFSRLAVRAGALVKQVGAAIEAPDATPDSVAEVLDRFVDAEGRRR
jgi:hypothetical protein